MARSSFELGLRLTCEQVRIAQNNKDRLDSARSADGAWAVQIVAELGRDGFVSLLAGSKKIINKLHASVVVDRAEPSKASEHDGAQELNDREGGVDVAELRLYVRLCEDVVKRLPVLLDDSTAQ